MKKFFSVILVIQMIIFGACSTQKDTFVSRTYHNVSSKYNVLYNGNIALEKGISELNNNYEDNYWEILPVEPLKINENFIDFTIKGDENSNKTSFDIAEEKAVKAVQKHGMYIKGKEKNKQIDDAYLLLGKARYYSQRFVPSLEAFEYSLKNDFNSDLSAELRIWKAKTYIRLQNEEAALHFLKLVLEKPGLKQSEEEHAHTALAMAYIELDSVPMAIKQLLLATETDNNKDQHARNLFILGQLYGLEKNIDSSHWAFNKVIEYDRSPNKYVIHAHLEKAKITEDEYELASLKEKLEKSAKNPSNKPYLDEIHYQLANIDFKQGNEKEALDHLSKSVKFPNSKKFQKVLSYEKIGDYYFDKADFVKAGSYYDSILPNIENSNTLHIKKLERKIKNLEDVIYYETRLSRNDSILKLVAMNEQDRISFFENYIAEIKKADEIIAIQKENAERAKISNNNNSFSNTKNENSKGKWYFYNTQTVSFGRDEFIRTWGKRDLKDNWRWADSKQSFTENNNSNIKNNKEVSNRIEKSYDVNTYLKAIPKDKEDIDKLREENSNSLYQLGLIYKEKFQEYTLAQSKLERFLDEDPKENLLLPAKYHLYKIYEKLGDSKLEQTKADIINKFPGSRYAQMLQNNAVNTENDSIRTPEMHYEKLYCDFEYEKYDSVITQCEEATKLYMDEPIQAKFELLKSYAWYHTQGEPKFVEGLEFVVNNFPKTEEAKHAQEVLNRINKIENPNSENNQKNNLKGEEVKIKKIENSSEEYRQLNEEEKRKKVLEMIEKQGGLAPATNAKKG